MSHRPAGARGAQTSEVPEVPGVEEAARELGELFGAVYARLHRRRPRGGLRADGAMIAAMQHLAHIGPLTVSEAARHLERAQSVISELVDRLAHHGLVERMSDARDRRRTLVWLTPAGLAALEAEREVLSRELVEGALGRMDGRARGELLAGLRALVTAADRMRGDVLTQKRARKRSREPKERP